MISNIPGLKFLISVITPEPHIKVCCLSRFKNEIFEFLRSREYLTTIIGGAFLLISGLLPLSSGTAATNTPVTDSEGNPSAMTIPALTPARIQPYLDAVLPVPGEDNQFWVFSGEYYRKVEVGQYGNEEKPLTGWRKFSQDWKTLKDKKHIDAFLQLPHREGTNKYQYWVFSGDQYLHIALDQNNNDSAPNGQNWKPLRNWNSLNEVRHVDTFIPLPDQENTYWVFSGDWYRPMQIAIDSNRTDTPLDQWKPLSDWNLLKNQQKIPASWKIPGYDNDYWVFSTDHYLHMRILPDQTTESVSGSWKEASGITGLSDTLSYPGQPVLEYGPFVISSVSNGMVMTLGGFIYEDEEGKTYAAVQQKYNTMSLWWSFERRKDHRVDGPVYPFYTRIDDTHACLSWYNEPAVSTKKDICTSDPHGYISYVYEFIPTGDKDESFYIRKAINNVYLTSPGDSPGDRLRFVKDLTKEPNQKWRLSVSSASSGAGSTPGIGGHPPGCQDCIRP
ncbi:hypothetical protein HBM95_22995 [Enterobacter asburiae]|nr:hypothetical protein [Enterobacter asburiae]